MFSTKVLLIVERGVLSTGVVAEQVSITNKASNGVPDSSLMCGSTSSCSTSCGGAEACEVSSSHSGDGGVGGGGALEVLSAQEAADIVTVLFCFLGGGKASSESASRFNYNT